MIVTLYRVYKGKMYSAQFIRQTRRYAAMNLDLGAAFEYRRVLTLQDCINFCASTTKGGAIELERDRCQRRLHELYEVMTAEARNLTWVETADWNSAHNLVAL